MKILDRKSNLGHALDAIDYQPILKSMAQSAIDAAFAGPNPAVNLQRDRSAGLAQAGKRVGRLTGPLKNARKPGLAAAAAVAGVAALSAAVSSERKRAESAS